MESFIILVGLGVILVVVVSVSFRLIEMRSRTVSQLSRVEDKLDLLLKQANIQYDPFANLPHEIADAARAGKKIQAIKLYRQWSGVGLKEAKDFIEEFQRQAK
jgi:Ribosomal protein L7/L12 C-terminal domain